MVDCCFQVRLKLKCCRRLFELTSLRMFLGQSWWKKMCEQCCLSGVALMWFIQGLWRQWLHVSLSPLFVLEWHLACPVPAMIWSAYRVFQEAQNSHDRGKTILSSPGSCFLPLLSIYLSISVIPGSPQSHLALCKEKVMFSCFEVDTRVPIRGCLDASDHWSASGSGATNYNETWICH